jgi:hypothetical protein
MTWHLNPGNKIKTKQMKHNSQEQLQTSKVDQMKDAKIPELSTVYLGAVVDTELYLLCPAFREVPDPILNPYGHLMFE